MKKIILASMIASVAMSASSAVSYAQTDNAPKERNVLYQRVNAPSASMELSGIVQEVSDDKMTVKGEDGRSYLVMLDQFSKIDGFKELELKAGTEVSMKSAQLNRITLSEDTGKAVTFSMSSVPAVLKETGKINTVMGILDEKAVSAVEKGSATIYTVEPGKDGEMVEAVTAMAAVTASAGDIDQTKEESTEQRKDGEAAERVATVTAVTIDAKNIGETEKGHIPFFTAALSKVDGTIKMAALDGENVKLCFVPEEITANGKTIKLHK